MKINSPLTSKEEVLPLIEAGADSFYAGVNFSKIFGNKILSSRWHCSNAEFQNKEEILEAAKLVKENKKEIYLTVNEHNYTPKHMEMVADFVTKHSKEFTGFIVSSLPLVLALGDKAELVASTGLRVMNHKSVKFYKNIGLKKIILPRTIMLDEAKNMIIKNPDIDLEMFILNHDCHYIDGLCGFSHFLFNEGFETGHAFNSIQTRQHLKKIINNNCGVCALEKMKEIGIKYIKIVGRINSKEKKVSDVMFLKKLLDKDSQNNFPKIAREEYNKHYKKDCGMQCFYRW